jgi:hypothetical protein
LRVAVNRTTASSSIDNTHPGLSISLAPGQPFGMIDVTGLSLIGNFDLTLIYLTWEQYRQQKGLSRGKSGSDL